MTVAAVDAGGDADRQPPSRERLADALWSRWPAWLWRRSPTAGLMAADGGWLRAIPGAGPGVPLAAALLGLCWGAIRPATQVTYSASTAIVLMMMGVALIGTGVAVWLWLGFVVGDLVFFPHPALVGPNVRPKPWDLVVQYLVPQMLSYLLLAVLLLAVPLTALVARGAIRGWLRPRSRGGALLMAPMGAALGAGLQAAAWSQSFPLLIRPLWIWRGRTPVADAIVPVQEHRWSFALARAGAATLLLAGLIETWIRAGVVFVALLAAFVFQAFFGAVTPFGRWWLARVPLGMRLLIAVAVAGGTAWLVGRRTVESASGISRIVAEDFGPMLTASVLAIVVVTLLLPRPVDRGGAQQ